MNAIVSASVGRAIVLDGDRIFSIESGALDALIPRTRRDMPFLLGEARDLEILEGVTVDQVQTRLDEALRHDDALRWTLSLLDGDLRETTRATLAKAAEPLFEDAGTRDFVEAVLYAQPIPEDLDPAGAEKIAVAACCRVIVGMLQDLRARQDLVRIVHAAWEALPIKVFGNHEDKVRARAAVVREGLFKRFVEAVAARESPDGIVAAALVAPRIRALPRSRDFLLKWSAQFAKRPPLRPDAAEENETDEEGAGEPQSQRRPATKKVSGHLVKHRVDEQQAQIRVVLARGDIDLARAMMSDLVTFQIQNGSSIFAVKSLCNMAAEAQRRGLRSLQDEWTAEAVRVGPADGWAWRQRGKALLDLARLDDALEAYSQADLFAGGVVAKNGRAEVLKAMGRFHDALRVYEEAALLHPEDVVAKTGRAEVLKAMGRFDDALYFYDEIAKLHPEDVVAKTGRAEVLKAMGRFDDALRLYDDAVKLHPEDVVAKSGRACLLALLGRSKEALRALPRTTSGTHDHWVVQHVRGMIFLRTGKATEAVILFEGGVRNCVFDKQRAYFRSALAVARLRQREYAAAAELLSHIELSYFSDVARLLQVHAFGELKQFDRAAEVARSVSATLPALLEKIRNEVNGRYVARTGAQNTDEELIRTEIQGCLIAV